MAIARSKPLDKLSGWTAFGVILASLAFSQYLSTNQATNMAASTSQRPLFTTPASSLPNLEQQVYAQINQHRAERNLPPLALDPRLSEQARNHSAEMASGQTPFSEDAFAPRSHAISQEFPAHEVAGTLAWNSGYPAPAQAAVSYWLRSANLDNGKSLAAIEGQYELAGVGVASNFKGQYYFTQVFVGRR